MNNKQYKDMETQDKKFLRIKRKQLREIKTRVNKNIDVYLKRLKFFERTKESFLISDIRDEFRNIAKLMEESI